MDSVRCRQEARLAAPATKLTGRLSRSLPLGGVCPTSFYQFIFFSFWVTGRAQVLADLGSLGSSLSRSLISWWCMSNWLVDLYFWYIYLLTCNIYINDRPCWSLNIYATVWCSTNHLIVSHSFLHIKHSLTNRLVHRGNSSQWVADEEKECKSHSWLDHNAHSEWIGIFAK